MTRDDVINRAMKFLEHVQEIINVAYSDYPQMQMIIPMVSFELDKLRSNTRYLRMVKTSRSGIDNSHVNQSVFLFVDLKNGDLRRGGWEKPYKHARGNVFDDDYGIRHVGPYGLAYLDTHGRIVKPAGKY